MSIQVNTEPKADAPTIAWFSYYKDSEAYEILFNYSIGCAWQCCQQK